jgi:membrane protease YdiL (CAAX protease family)
MSNESNSQYSLAQILGIWLAVAAPMGILGYVVTPALSPNFELDPIGAAKARVGLLTVGLIWQFVLSMIIVYREEGNLRWATIRRRLWLNTPRDPQTGEPRRKLWLWLIPFTLLFFALFPLRPLLDRLWVSVFPFFAAPAGSDPGVLLSSPELQVQLVGDWLFLGLFLSLAVFNTVGEEFLFRGVLLPKMEGVFGKWDWVVNGVLMAAYHWHQPWGIANSMVVSALCYSLPARRFRSTWMSIVVHGIQYVFFIPIILLVLGLA